MKKEWNAVETLRHSRHDWLNKLQLIKGNLTLNRVDRANQIIDEIIMNAKHEANLSNLNAPKFACYLMTFNWEDNHFTIEYEVLGEVRDLECYDSEITSWCFHFFKQLNESVKKSAHNHLSISIDLIEEEPRFFLDFSGILIDEDYIKEWINEQTPYPSIQIVEKEIHKNEFTVVLKLKS